MSVRKPLRSCAYRKVCVLALFCNLFYVLNVLLLLRHCTQMTIVRQQ